MRYNKNGKLGFTLIELLAVIVILAVIALISTPIVLNIIEDARKEAYKSSSLNVFKAAEIYEAKNGFSVIDQDGIDIKDLNLDNNTFTGGKIIKNENGKLELVNVTDGVYCAKGTKEKIIVLKGSCDTLDKTAPTNVSIATNSISSNRIVIAIQAEDLESGIKEYHYSLDGITYQTSKSSMIEISGLESGKTYHIYVKVENNNGIISDVVQKEVTTNDIDLPTYSATPTGWSTSKTVTITYPERQTGFVYEYSTNGGLTWKTVETGTSTTVTFTENGSVIARIYDGTNYKTASSYTVSQIDTTAPTVTVTVTKKTTNSITVQIAGNDNESGIANYRFVIEAFAGENDMYTNDVNIGTNQTYTFTGLKSGCYWIYGIVTNGSGLSIDDTVSACTTEIPNPTYSIDKSGWAKSKLVTITYPERQTGFVYQYSTDGGTNWTTVSSGITASVTFTSNGSVIARIYDGINYKTANAYEVSGIDTTSPTFTVSAGGMSLGSSFGGSVSIRATDSGSGINESGITITSNDFYGTIKYDGKSGDEYRFTIGPGSYSEIFDSSFTARICDNAGNCSSQTFYVIE